MHGDADQPPRDHMVGEGEGEDETWCWRGCQASQRQADALYNICGCQIIVSVLILSNFVANICKNQTAPGDSGAQPYRNLDAAFNVVFLFELVLNMWGTWFRPFFRSAWNWFDSLVVFIGVMDLLDKKLPSPLHLLRLLRAFRVFRLFKRIKSLHKIMMSLLHALPGVSNAFLINLLVMGIYAVLATEFFRDVYANDCMEANRNDPEKKVGPMFTARGLCYGEDYYGTFGGSLYTLFQVLTGESWSEMVVRPVIHYYLEKTDELSAFGASCFFVSFIGVNAFVLINVVVAVLLDGMTAQGTGEEADSPVQVPPAAIENSIPDEAIICEEVRGIRREIRETLMKFKSQLKEQGKDFGKIQAGVDI